MANKTKLKRKMIAQIAELVKLRMPWNQISAAIGVTYATLKNWRDWGIKAREENKRGIYRELVDAIDQARTELFESYARNVQNEALHGKETETEREIHHKDGSIVIEKTTKKEPPNAMLALKILGMEAPEIWAENQNIRVNWQETLESQGQDPDGVKGLIKTYLEMRAVNTSEDASETDAEDDATPSTTTDTTGDDTT